MMTCMNLVIISVMYGSQSNLIEIVGGTHGGVVIFRMVASFAIFILFFYVLYTYFYIRYYSDILSENRNSLWKISYVGTHKPSLETSQSTEETQPSKEMVLFKKPTSAPLDTTNQPPSTAMVLAKPSTTPAAPSSNAMVLANTTPKTEIAKPSNGLIAPPGLH